MTLPLLAAAAALALTAVFPPGLDPYTDAKLAAWAALLGAAWLRLSGPGPLPRRAPLDGAVAACLAAAALSAVFSVDRPLSLIGPAHLRADGLLPLAAVACGYALARLCGLAANPAPFLAGLAAAGAALGAGALLERAGLPAFPGLNPELVDGRVTSLAGSPVYLGASLVACLPAALQLAAERRGGARAAAAAAAALCVAGLWLSHSRGAWLSAAAACAVWAALGVLPARLRAAAALLALASTAALPLLTAVRPAASRSDHARLVLWKTTARLAAERPWTGWGTGAFETAFARRVGLDFIGEGGRRHTQASAHNDLLQAAASAGAPGAAALLLLWVCLALAAWTAAADPGRPAGAAAAAALAGLFVQAKVNPLPFGVLAAAALWAAAAVPAAPAPGRRPPWLAPGAAALCAVLAFLSARAVAADRAHRSGLEAHRAGRFPEAERALRRAAELNPADTGPAYVRAVLLTSAARAASPENKGRFADAAVAAAEGLVRRRPGAASGWHALGLALQVRGRPGDLQSAARSLDAALERDWRRQGVLEARAALFPESPEAAAARSRLDRLLKEKQ